MPIPRTIDDMFTEEKPLGKVAPQPGGAPTKQTLARMLADKRLQMLGELRDIEQALEALERVPEFEPTLQRVMKYLQRSY